MFKKISKFDRAYFEMKGTMILIAAALLLVSFKGDSCKSSGEGVTAATKPGKATIVNLKITDMQQADSTGNAFPGNSELAAIGLATGWLNSRPLSSMDLKGKVVLINFWTYTCINWLRTLPYVKAWDQKYKDNGLVIIGVHTPEFSFEKNIDNVRKLTADLGVGFPVAIDNDYDIWYGFDNKYWPALYFIDAKGKLRYEHFGEGNYEEAENAIRQLLTEAGAEALDQHNVVVEGKGFEAAPDWTNLQSSENYLGFKRTQHFASPGGAVPGRRHNYRTPEIVALNQWALSGDWKMEEEFVLLNKANGKIGYSFHSRDLHMVMGPANAVSPVRFRVLIDGHAPGADHGMDIDEQGYGVLKKQRLYQLIRQSGGIENRRFEIEFFEAGAEAYSFTFG